MRKSIVKGDKGYDQKAWRYSVYLDDERMEYVFTADEKQGFITVFDQDGAGSFMQSGPDRPAMKKLEGKVRIIKD